MDVPSAARALEVTPARVRALIAAGELEADKVGGRWLVHWDSVIERRRAKVTPGRPLTARNAWALLLEASGDEPPADIGQHARWRIDRTLAREGIAELSSRLDRRAVVQRMWALPGELRHLRADNTLALTGSSAAGALRLDLAAPDTVDAYLPAWRLDELRREHDLESIAARDANVILRAVPDDAWYLSGRRVAPRAAVGLDLASYPDSRSARVGRDLLSRLDSTAAKR